MKTAHILAIDPGLLTGICLLDTETLEFHVSEVDMRISSSKEAVAKSIKKCVSSLLYSLDSPCDVVVEDFILRRGQNVDTTPLYVLGYLDAGYKTVKYTPSAHKSGNSAYNLSEIVKGSGQKVGAGHVVDALSLAVHHLKIKDTPKALKMLEGYRK